MLKRVYETGSLALRISWLCFAIISFFTASSELLLFSLEYGVLLLLVFEVHPRITKGLDPISADEKNLFVNDVGIRTLVVLLVFFYSLLLLNFLEIELPHFFDRILNMSLPGSLSGSLFLILSSSFVSGVLAGYYVYKKDPEVEGTLHRTYANLLKFGSQKERRKEIKEAGEALRSEGKSQTEIARIIICLLVVGVTISITSILLSVILVMLIGVSEIVIITVIAWLLYDILNYRFSLSKGVNSFVNEFSKEIEIPKRWFFEFEIKEAGLKGILATIFVVLGIFLTLALIGLLISPLTESLGNVYPYLLGSKNLHKISILSSILLPFFGVGSYIIFCIYSFILWHTLMKRLPVWTRHFWKKSDEKVRVNSLPWNSTYAYPLLFLTLLIFSKYIGSIPKTAIQNNILIITFSFGLLFLSFSVIFYKGIKSLAECKIKIENLKKDNFRICLFLLALIGIAAFFAQKFLVYPFLAGLTLLYFFPEVERFTGEKTEDGKIHQLTVYLYVLLISALIILPSIEWYPSIYPIIYLIPIFGIVMLAGSLFDWINR